MKRSFRKSSTIRKASGSDRWTRTITSTIFKPKTAGSILYIPELMDTVKGIDAEQEEAALRPDPAFPLILMAGRHTSMNANTLMRDPAWNAGKRACTLAMHPADAETLKLMDGQQVRVTTEAGSARD